MPHCITITYSCTGESRAGFVSKIFLMLNSLLLLFGASPVAQLVKNMPTEQETPVWFLGWEDSPEESMATHSRTPAWRIPMVRGAWRATVPSLKSCPTLCDPVDCYVSPLSFSVHGISQARILEGVAISFCRGSSQPRDWTRVFCVSSIGRRILYHWATREANLITFTWYETDLPQVMMELHPNKSIISLK